MKEDSGLNHHQQQLIDRFLKSPLAAVRNAGISDGLKIIAFKAMVGEDIASAEHDELTQASLMVQIELVQHVIHSFGNQGNTGNCYDDSPDLLGLLSYHESELPLTQVDIGTYISGLVSEEINEIFPSLVDLAARALVHAEFKHQASFPMNQCPKDMDTMQGCHNNLFFVDTTKLTVEYLDHLYRLEPELIRQHHRSYLEDVNGIFMRAVIRRSDAIKEIKRNLLIYPRQTFDYSLNNRKEINVDTTLYNYLNNCSNQIVGSMLANQVWDYTYFSRVARNGYLQVLQWLWSKGSAEQRSAMLMAHQCGAFIYAAENGHLSVLQWLWSKGGTEQQSAMLMAHQCAAFIDAAKNGHLSVSQWLWSKCSAEQQSAELMANQCGVFIDAAKNGHLSVLQWLWSKYSCEDQKRLWVICKNEEEIDLSEFYLTIKKSVINAPPSSIAFFSDSDKSHKCSVDAIVMDKPNETDTENYDFSCFGLCYDMEFDDYFETSEKLVTSHNIDKKRLRDDSPNDQVQVEALEGEYKKLAI